MECFAFFPSDHGSGKGLDASMRPTWIDPQSVLIALERKADREAIERARAYHRQNRARIVEERSEGQGFVVLGTVVDRRSVRHETTLNIESRRIQAACDCDLPRWPCAHVLAVTRTWSEERPPQPPSLEVHSGWKTLMEALAGRPRRPIPGPGTKVFVHWVDLRQDPAGEWVVCLCWRVHKMGAHRLGRGRMLPPDMEPSGLPRCATEADIRVLRVVRAASATRQHPGTPGTVTLAGEQVDPILRALSRAAWVCWDEDRSPVQFDLRPVSVRLVATEGSVGLRLRADFRDADGSLWDTASVRVVGNEPPWVERGGCLRPVLGVEKGRALVLLTNGGARVPERDLPAFLGSTVPGLESQGLEVDLEGLEDRTFLLSETPTPRLYLSEEAGMLVGSLRFAYGDYEVFAENPEMVFDVGAGGQRAYLRRDVESEFQSTVRLREAGLRMTEPGRFEADGDEALDFLRTQLAGLASEWEVFGQDDLKRYRVTPIGLSLRVRLGIDVDWLDLSFEAEATGDEVRATDVIRSLRRGSRYVRLGSGAHALLPEEWSQRLGPVLEDLSLRSARARLPLHVSPLVEELLEGAPTVEYAGREAWEKLISALRGGGSIPAVDPPDGLAAVLRPYQLWGYRWLRFMGVLGLGCVLADDMGLGKTVQALGVLLAEVEQGEDGPSLVVAPTSVVPNWEAEARRFAPGLRVLRYHGTHRKNSLHAIEGHDLVLTSYAVLRRDIEELASVRWRYAVLDEAQAIKNAATQTARAARRLKADRRLALTGTPLENHLGELWSQFHFLMPGLLGSERLFTRKFARPITQGNVRAEERLQRRIRPFILRRLKSDVAQDLPEKVESVLWCEMGSEQDRLYRTLFAASRERVLREMEVKGLARARFSVLEALLRLRQTCCHPEILPAGVGEGVPSAKFDLLRDFVGEVIEEGHRVLVFSQFIKVLEILRQWVQDSGIPHLYLDGRTRKREERVQRFQEDESIPVFLVSLKAGGAGINLTGADYVILYDPWWNPAVEIQATDRAHRIGQRKKVFAYKMITRGTVEEKILALQERKRDLTEGLIQSGTAWEMGLTETDIEQLFAD